MQPWGRRKHPCIKDTEGYINNTASTSQIILYYKTACVQLVGVVMVVVVVVVEEPAIAVAAAAVAVAAAAAAVVVAHQVEKALCLLAEIKQDH